MLKKVTITVISVTAATMMMSGCAQNEPQISQAPAQVKNKFANAPKWVLNPQIEGGIAAVGIAQVSPAGMQFQRTEAMANGRDELVRQLELKVSNMVKSFTQVTGAGSSASLDKVASSVSKQVASQTLSGSKQKDMWIADDGELYILMVLDPNAVAQATKDATKTSFKNDQALWQQFQSKKAQDELASEIDKMVK
jgi:hypothetical protein